MSGANTPPAGHKNFPSAIVAQKGAKVNIDEIIDGLQKTIEELKEERKHLIRLEQNAASLISMAQMWFEEHEQELPEVDQ